MAKNIAETSTKNLFVFLFIYKFFMKGLISKYKSQLNGGLEGSNIRIKVRRNKLIEDGINQIGSLPINLLKSTIRVVFINELVLKKVGIYEDGVFNESLIGII